MTIHHSFRSEEFKAVFTDYKNLVIAKGYKTGNGTMYPKAVASFFQYLEQNFIWQCEHISSEIILTYYQHLIERPNRRRKGALSNCTINHHLFALRLLVKFFQDQGITQNSLVVPPNLETKRKISVLTKEDVKYLFEACENNLEKALLALAYGCGLRREEMTALTIRDIDFTRGSILIRHGKGNKIREVAMANQVKKMLHDYFIYTRLTQERNVQNSRSVSSKFLLTNQGNEASGNYLNRLLKTILSRTQVGDHHLQGISLHSLRHAIATHLAENGAEMEMVSEFLGHETIDTSSLYMIRRKRQHSCVRMLGVGNY